jgi:hypothetical protein
MKEKIEIFDVRLPVSVSMPPISPEKLSTELPPEIIRKDLLLIIRAKLKEIEAAVDKLEKVI